MFIINDFQNNEIINLFNAFQIDINRINFEAYYDDLINDIYYIRINFN